METRLDWVRNYYSKAGEYWASTGVDDRDRERVAIVKRLCGPVPLRILELGAGACGTAAALADIGHEVVAIEFAPLRANFGRELAQQPRSGALTVIEDDFYNVQLDGKFDVICYWDGFGIGTDSDQRRLLKRMALDWLTPRGSVLIDVFCPWKWVREANREEILNRNHPSHRYCQRRRADFDPIQSCFIDEWCPIDDASGQPNEGMAITQTIRCYSPADFLLLLECTGLNLGRAEIGGKDFDPHAPGTKEHPIWESWDFLAVLSAC